MPTWIYNTDRSVEDTGSRDRTKGQVFCFQQERGGLSDMVAASGVQRMQHCPSHWGKEGLTLRYSDGLV